MSLRTKQRAHQCCRATCCLRAHEYDVRFALRCVKRHLKTFTNHRLHELHAVLFKASCSLSHDTSMFALRTNRVARHHEIKVFPKMPDVVFVCAREGASLFNSRLPWFAAHCLRNHGVDITLRHNCRKNVKTVDVRFHCSEPGFELWPYPAPHNDQQTDDRSRCCGRRGRISTYDRASTVRDLFFRIQTVEHNTTEWTVVRVYPVAIVWKASRTFSGPSPLALDSVYCTPAAVISRNWELSEHSSVFIYIFFFGISFLLFKIFPPRYLRVSMFMLPTHNSRQQYVPVQVLHTCTIPPLELYWLYLVQDTCSTTCLLL